MQTPNGVILKPHGKKWDFVCFFIIKTEKALSCTVVGKLTNYSYTGFRLLDNKGTA